MDIIFAPSLLLLLDCTVGTHDRDLINAVREKLFFLRFCGIDAFAIITAILVSLL